MNESRMNETELTDLLERGSRLQAPDVEALVAGGTARGRRSLRRRRVGTASAAVLATAGVATSIVLLARGGVIATDPSTPVAATGSTAPSTPASTAPSTEPSASARRVVQSDGNGPVTVTARLRTIAEIHADIQRILGPGASDPLQGPSRPVTDLDGDELSWFFRFDGAEAQVHITPFPGGCAPSGEDITPRSDCLKTTTGIGYSTFGPFKDLGYWQQTVDAWHHGFMIMIISKNVHEDLTDTGVNTRVVADKPTIAMDRLVSLATSDIWFQPAG
jgi:hypothetical protein